jgi:Ras-related C3 botulinum toxin substrate 1
MSTSPSLRAIKVTMVGAPNVGKTSLALAYLTGEFPSEDLPTVVDATQRVVKVPEHPEVELSLWDTAGQEDYDRVRPIHYPGTDMFLVCYSVVTFSEAYHMTSFEAVSRMWIPEITHHVPDALRLLVACKMDLREDQATLDQLKANDEQTPITTAQGKALATEMGAAGFVECSAKSQIGVQEVFLEALRIALLRKPSEGPGSGDRPAHCLLQ